MHKTWLSVVLVHVLVACAVPSARAAKDPLDALQARIIDVGKKLTPSVVHIESAQRQNNRRNIVTGSGIVYTREGMVLTNEHVVERAEKISVVVPGRSGKYAATLIGTDKLTDLAVLKIEPRPNDAAFAAVTLGDSDALAVGQWVIAIGNPYGLDGTVSLGIVSAKGRDLSAANLLNDFIQTDAMIDHGSSGGPLVDLQGRLVGVNSRGQGRGIGFTIPVNTAKRVAADLMGSGIERGYLGIAIQPLQRELARYWKLDDVSGVVVNGVAHDSPAARGGLRPGDILTRFDGEDVTAEKGEDVGQFQRLVARTPVGKRVAVELLRDGKPQKLELAIGVQPKIVPDEEETVFGFTVQEVTEATHRQYRLPSRDGVLVSFVESGSEADEATMLLGDLVQRVEDVAVTDIESFRRAMRSVDPVRPFLVHALRGDETRFLLILPRRAEPRVQERGAPAAG
jgi:serine protease Do